MTKQKLTPILKWAGGKTQLMPALTAKIPKKYNKYYEPFVGGGALFLELQPQQAVINDINEQLVNLYRQIKNNVNSVIWKVNKLDAPTADKEYYYALRARYNEKIIGRELDAESAALMIWLNKHCFNGLYRVNNKGLFNVPFNNRQSGSSIVKENLLGIAKYLQESNVAISCADFYSIAKSAKSGDFVYFDSPYVPVSATASFTDYTKLGFSLADHERLAELFKKLDAEGVKLMLSNNDVPLVHELYASFNIETLEVKRMINSKANKRISRELIVTNY